MRESQERREPTSPVGHLGDLTLLMASTQTGVVLLLELLPPWPLQMHWLDHQVRVLAPAATRQSAGESVLAVFLSGAGVAEGWRLKEELRERAIAQHITLFAGLASWPGQGSTPMDVVAAAAAGLVDEQSSYRDSLGEEVRLELDGLLLALGVAGEFLSG